jgi:phage terminase large subunit GpA-like protein
MMDGIVLSSWRELERAFRRGIAAFAVPEPLSLPEWAAKHFYLSAESSYIEGAWRAWPFQLGIMACMSNDDVRELDLRKSARVGYTKMILACMGYTAHHKRRNQALWQPTDDDAVEFVKTELDCMLRDVAIMLEVFPAFLRRDKDNTLTQKKFLTSMLHIRGGKAAKNFRRISIDTAYLDELDAFDADVEKEGSPVKLAAKRIEGATFPKLIVGTTPKLKGFSLIEGREAVADVFLRYYVPCPHCEEFHPLTFGGKDEPHGFKWQDHDPDTVRHLCPHCGAMIHQGDYLSVWERGRWQSDDGITMDASGAFYDRSGETMPTPAHVAVHIWTAYSPSVAWPAIVREFLDAIEKHKVGRDEDMKAFRNTTLGETWAEHIEQTEATELRARAEPLPLGRVPENCLLLLAGADTQDNRIEVGVWGFGRGSQMWTIDHKILWGNPAEDQIWIDLARYLFEAEFLNAFGQAMRIEATAIDSGGHHAQAVYEFARRHAARRVYAVRGYSGRERHIKQGAGKVDIDWRGRMRKAGVILWQVGTNLAKDLIHGRLQITKPGPGYIHFSDELTDEWFAQFTGEARAVRRTAIGDESRWTPIRRRVEVLDCAVYAIWLETQLDLGRKGEAFWGPREAILQPAIRDMFAVTEAAPAAPAAEAPQINEKLSIEEMIRRARRKETACAR